MPGIEFADVARLVSAEQFAQREMKLVRGRAQCPFHGGEHYNLAFYRGDGRCHCFTCHKTADSVQLAAAVWHTSQVEAAQLLNEEFRLGLSASDAPTAAVLAQRQREREERDRQREADRLEWGAAADNLRDAENALQGATVADAENPATWAKIARLAQAQLRWENLQAGRG
jgi:hypothetical protein